MRYFQIGFAVHSKSCYAVPKFPLGERLTPPAKVLLMTVKGSPASLIATLSRVARTAWTFVTPNSQGALQSWRRQLMNKKIAVEETVFSSLSVSCWVAE